MRHKRSGERGFTLIEVIVTTVVLVVVMVGLYVLLDSSNKLAKQETNVADAQQSARIGIYELSRIIRQGRVGGLFVGNAILPVNNNIAGGTSLRDLSRHPALHPGRYGRHRRAGHPVRRQVRADDGRRDVRRELRDDDGDDDHDPRDVHQRGQQLHRGRDTVFLRPRRATSTLSLRTARRKW